MITNLQPNQVYVFGSNAQGFHGAGSAGMAMRGTSQNTWRTDPDFQKAMKAPVGSKDRVGKWAVYGMAYGYQHGREGNSYAIMTVLKPGAKRSIDLSDIKVQFEDLFSLASEYPHWEFIMTPVGCGYSGYSNNEMNDCWMAAIEDFGTLPKNIIVPEAGLYKENPADADT